MQHDRIHQLSSNTTEVGRLPQDRSSVATSVGLCATITRYRPERPWQNLKHEFLFLCYRSHCFDAALALITSDCISVTGANCFIISYLWPSCAADADIIFLPCGFFFLSFLFPRLISAATDWMSTILLHMAWP